MVDVVRMILQTTAAVEILRVVHTDFHVINPAPHKPEIHLDESRWIGLGFSKYLTLSNGTRPRGQRTYHIEKLLLKCFFYMPSSRVEKHIKCEYRRPSGVPASVGGDSVFGFR